jgi:hypothetical protein
MMIENPFIYGPPITDPLQFIGRRDQLHQIYGYLTASKNVLVVGGRRIGKTSLLKVLSQPQFAVANGFDVQKVTFAYVDFQEFPIQATSVDFWRFVFNKLMPQPEPGAWQAELETVLTGRHVEIADISRLLDEISRSGLKVVLLLDEIEYFSRHPALDTNLFGTMNMLCSLGRINVIAACHREPASESIESDIDFFESLSVIRLPCFIHHEAEELVYRSLQKVNAGFEFEPAEFDLAFQLSGGYPFFFQMACSYLFDAYQSGQVLPERLKYVQTEIAKEMAQHFRYFWEASTDQEQQILQLMAGEQNQLSERPAWFSLGTLQAQGFVVLEESLSSLVGRSLIVKDNGCFTLLLPLFSEWLRQSYPLDAGTKLPAQQKSWIKRWLFALRRKLRI